MKFPAPHEAFEVIVGYAHQPRFALALFLMIISNLGWIMPLLIVPMEYADVEHKAFYITAWVVFGQVTYNIGFFLAGAELVKKLGKKGHPLHYIHVQLKLFVKSITKRFPHR